MNTPQTEVYDTMTVFIEVKQWASVVAMGLEPYLEHPLVLSKLGVKGALL